MLFRSLVEQGLVERRPHESDKRVVFVRLTSHGKVRVDSALTDLLKGEEILIANISKKDRILMADLLSQILTPLDDIED